MEVNRYPVAEVSPKLPFNKPNSIRKIDSSTRPFTQNKRNSVYSIAFFMKPQIQSTLLRKKTLISSEAKSIDNNMATSLLHNRRVFCNLFRISLKLY